MATLSGKNMVRTQFLRTLTSISRQERFMV